MLPREGFIIALAGPAASLLAAIALGCLAIATGTGPEWWDWLPAMSSLKALYDAARNTIPRYHAPTESNPDEYASDGYLARRAWRAGLGSSEPLIPPDEPPTTMAYHVRLALNAAAKRALAERCGHVGTEHIALALSQHDAAAARVFAKAGAKVDDIERAVRFERHETGPQLVYTPAATRALRRAQAALTLHGDRLIESEHLLLGLVEEPDARLGQILRQLGTQPNAVRAAALSALR